MSRCSSNAARTHSSDEHKGGGTRFWHLQTWAALRLVITVSLVLSTASCGKKNVQAKVYPVKGTVLFDGQPATGATVMLRSADAELPPDVVPTGKVISDGKFEISSYGDADGAPPGDYVAVIDWRPAVQQPNGATRPGPSPISAIYAKPDSSPLKVTVNESPNELAPFELTK